MTESEAYEIVRRYEALLHAVSMARSLDVPSDAQIFTLTTTNHGLALERAVLEGDNEGGCCLYRRSWDISGLEVEGIDLAWLDDEETMWPLTPFEFRFIRSRDAHGRFGCD